ncbi:glutathione peroxidase [Noviherbaspirillum saxi]|uniref:Glutathione peroxidase n=1 Tax=Noviherbaspirillum saxi TaxID=2320863 RepID=A0A3A3FK59_9BURK|nr:glutathione peroxidase [Noviherbaspirillum saxi]RJF91725.1 glutathione peroxidase [Noviherbaspirillum saxi]
MSTELYDVPFRRISGEQITLGEYRGKVLLLVNVASKCGLTPQYNGLEKLYEDKQAAGLVVVGFPANDFGAQEPGSNDEIVEFCAANFGVKFPMTEKISVKGEQQHPLYQLLVSSKPTATETRPGAMRNKLASYGFKQNNPSDVLWNFEKFLIGRNGDVVGRFAPDVAPDDPVLLAAIEKELG